MKKLILLLFIISSTFAKAQSTLASFATTLAGRVVYESIENVSGKNMDFIYYNADKWILNIPNNIKSRVLTEDKDQGQIAGTGSFTHTRIIGAFAGDVNYKFKIQIDCKDNKYRIRLYDISYSDPTQNDYTRTIEDVNKELIKSNAQPRHIVAAEVDGIFKEILSSLKDAINKASNDDF